MHRALARLAALTPLALALPAAPASGAQDPPRERQREAAAAKQELYFPERPDTRALYYGIEGELDEDELDGALAELEDPDTALLYGPEAFPTRPKSFFAALETGASVRSKDVAKALKRAGGKPQELAWLVVRWNPTEPPAGGGRAGRGGGGARAQLMAMSGDIRWVDGGGDQLVFYYAPGKLDAQGILSRFEKIFTRSGRSADELGFEVVVDSFEWLLEGPLDPDVARRVEKAIGKLDGVTLASIDATACRLRVSIRLEGIVASGPPGKLGGGGGGRGGGRGGGGRGGPGGSGLRPCFDTLPVFDLLEEHGLVVVVPEEEAETPPQ